MGFLGKLAVLAAVIGAFVSSKPVMADPYAPLASGGAGGWLNVTRPITAEDMKGRLVLLDFWTYGCINCIHVVPDLKKLEQKFGDSLLVIGVHSAKFKGEQGNERILSAAKRFGLEHPVINDSDFAIWRQFKVEAWPTLVLLGADGQEISRYEGEGHFKDLDRDISKNISSTVPHEVKVSSLVLKEQTKSMLSFPARIKKYGDLLYVADSGNNRILAVDKSGKIVRKFDGFHNPRGLALGKNNMLYVADTDAHNLVELNMVTGERKVIAGDGTRNNVWASPWDIEFISDDVMLIAMAGTHRIVIYDLADEEYEFYAGNGREDVKDGDLENAELAQPSALTKNADGTVYFADAESSALREIKGDQVKTLIGTGLFDFGFVDGVYPAAKLQHPQGVHAIGNKVYIADTYNNAIRVYDVTSKQLSTIKTSGESLNEPGAIWVDGDVAYIADTNNNRVLNLDLKTGTLSPFKIQ